LLNQFWLQSLSSLLLLLFGRPRSASSAMTSVEPEVGLTPECTAARTSGAGRRLLKTLRNNWPLLGTVGSVIAALLTPEQGAVFYEHISTPSLVVLFLALSFTIPLERLRQGVFAFHAHALCQIFNLVAMPLLYYVVAYRYKWPQQLGILTDAFGVGVMTVMCMPTTGNLCSLLTCQAGGDDAVAAFNSALGNVLGIVVTPLTVSWVLGLATGWQKLAAEFRKLSEQMLLPAVVGVLLQVLVRRLVPQCMDRMLWVVKRLLNTLILVLFYGIFSAAFAKGASSGVDSASAGKMVAWVACVHLCFLISIWFLARCFPMRRRIAITFVASEKTEGLALALISILFHGSPDQGLYFLPAAAHHVVQLFVGTLLLRTFKRLAEREESLQDALLACSESESRARRLLRRMSSTFWLN